MSMKGSTVLIVRVDKFCQKIIDFSNNTEGKVWLNEIEFSANLWHSDRLSHIELHAQCLNIIF